MQQVIKLLSDLEIVIYLVLGILFAFALRQLVMSLNESRNSIFGLEKEAAQKKVTSAVTFLVLIGLMAITEFIASTFLISELPQQVSFSTPTIAMEVTASPTKVLGENETPQPTNTPYPQAAIEGIVSNCIENVLEFTYPVQGDSVSGVVELIGNVNTLNFGSYTYAYSTAGEINWVTIAAGGEIRIDESLGFWFTGSLIPGDYLLQLVALDNEGKELTPCVINVSVLAETED